MFGASSLSDTFGTIVNGTQSLLTDASTDDWNASITGFGGADVGVVDLGANGTAPWGFFAAMGDACFIWADSASDLVYFSSTITVIPAPSAAALLLSGGLIARRRRRRA